MPSWWLGQYQVTLLGDSIGSSCGERKQLAQDWYLAVERLGVKYMTCNTTKPRGLM